MRYTGKYTEQISFPLGGIGTGCIGLSGSGRLVDWEIFGAPNKRSDNGYSHFAVKAEKAGKVTDARILNSDLPAPYMGDQKSGGIHSGFGFGPNASTMAGFPHFYSLEFTGEFPIAGINFRDSGFPGQISLTAFNPFIPMDSRNSGIPAAFFEFEIHNDTADDLEYTIAFAVQNPVGKKAVRNHFIKKKNRNFLCLECNEFPGDDYRYGNLCLATDQRTVSFQEYWYRGGWNDGIETYWHDFTTDRKFRNRSYEGEKSGAAQDQYDTGVLAAHLPVRQKESRKVRFVLAWYFPNMAKSWDTVYQNKSMAQVPVWKNYYATQYSSSWDCAEYSLKEFDSLFAQTFAFKQALHTSTMPKEAVDAISANLSTLKSPAVLCLPEGSFYGFEGCIDHFGCCEGSCQHVWNYAYALPFLFPDLQRSVLEREFDYSMRDDGRMGFRLQLPLGSPPQEFHACVDGQMGAVIRAYREWKISGDNRWLVRYWPKVKLALEYAWAETNEDKWDIGKTGVITGRQHHTLDMELFGANSWLEGFYLCALKAAAEMAEAMGETDKQQEYLSLYLRGKEWTDKNLFQGEYYGQKIDYREKALLEPYRGYRGENEGDILETYWNSEAGEIKYQLGEGCLIDQVIGQWHADNCGLGEIFDPEQAKKALGSIYRNNYISNMREFANPWRLYCLNDEGGVIMCSWPKGKKKPVIPITYNSETMNGFEYQVACHMLRAGMEAEAEEIVAAVRQRYDGYKRNPYNEIECGSNYARSMASYGLLLAYSGFQYDMIRKHMGFYPVNEEGRFFWSICQAWGTVEIDKKGVKLQVLFGKLTLKSFSCSAFAGQVVCLDRQISANEYLYLSFT